LPPFYVSEQGWGEFPILIEVVLKNGESVKLSHYLKLTSPDPIVVNETYDTLIMKSSPVVYDLSKIPDLRALPDVPVFSEFFASGAMFDYQSAETQFLETNSTVLEQLKARVHDLTRKALQKDIEVYTVLNKSPKKSAAN